MATRQIEPTIVGRRRRIRIGMRSLLVVLVALMVAGWLTRPMPALPAVAPEAEQPTVGSAMTITGLVYDGTRYTSAPIAVAAPNGGRGYTVTALVFSIAARICAIVAGHAANSDPRQYPDRNPMCPTRP